MRTSIAILAILSTIAAAPTFVEAATGSLEDVGPRSYMPGCEETNHAVLCCRFTVGGLNPCYSDPCDATLLRNVPPCGPYPEPCSGALGNVPPCAPLPEPCSGALANLPPCSDACAGALRYVPPCAPVEDPCAGVLRNVCEMCLSASVDLTWLASDVESTSPVPCTDCYSGVGRYLCDPCNVMPYAVRRQVCGYSDGPSYGLESVVSSPLLS